MHTLSGKKQNQTKPVGERRGHSREIRRSRDAATVQLRRAMLLRPAALQRKPVGDPGSERSRVCTRVRTCVSVRVHVWTCV